MCPERKFCSSKISTIKISNYYKKPYEIERGKIITKIIEDISLNTQCYEKLAVDIGCGPGYFTGVLSTNGWKITAIDIDNENIESAGNYANETHLGEAIAVLSKMPSNYYDLALALEIIEHMSKPSGEAFLRAIRRVLKQNGKMIISTPNKHSIEGLGGYYWGEKIRGNGRWKAWDSTHIHIYSSREILQLLKLNNFSIDKTIGYWYEGRLPFIGRWRLPFLKSTVFPFNRIGFNIILVSCP